MSIVGSEQWMYSAGAAGFYDFPIEQSLRFEDGDSAYLSRTPATAGNRKTWTYSGWVKRGNLGQLSTFLWAANGSAYDILSFTSSDQFYYLQWTGSAYTGRKITNAVFRDVSAWYHIVVAIDGTNATAANRIKIYINGEQQTSFATSNDHTGADGSINTTNVHHICQQTGTYFDGYMAEVNFIDGQALDPTSFGETKSGIWIPKDTSGLTFGTNGFRLAFADGAAIGDDTSGNTNDFTANNLVASDVVLDSPTNNFAVLNNLETNDSGATYTEGNLVFQTQSAGSNVGVASFSIPKSSKWYWEVNVLSTSGTIGDNARIGLQVGNNITPSLDVRYKSNGDKSVNNASSAYGASYAAGDIIGVAVDADSNTVEFYKNGSSQGSISYTMDADSDYFPVLPEASGTINIKFAINFGQDSTFAGNEVAGGNTDANGIGDFFSTVPSGYLSLCSANLPSGAIDTLNDETPEDYFNTVLYTGNGTSQSITNVGFSPDVLWLKERSSTSHHQLFHDIDGGVPKFLQTSSTIAEVQNSAVVSSFDADGFSVGNSGGSNQSGQTYVGWNWYTGASPTSNTDGSITSTVSVGATSQQNWFSVVSYTGTGANATVGHGLGGTVPDMIIAKRRNTTGSWGVYHSGMTSATYQMWLNLTNGETSRPAQWNSTAPTSSVFSIGTDTDVNASGSDYIAYCFANAEGLCKVGSYTGNGSTNGTFIHTGFRPAFVLVKSSSNTSPWLIMDNTRDTDNQIQYLLRANSNGAETTNAECDFLSNGFKYRGTSTNSDYYHNVNTATYIYLAIASQGFKYANAR